MDHVVAIRTYRPRNGNFSASRVLNLSDASVIINVEGTNNDSENGFVDHGYCLRRVARIIHRNL